MKLELAYRCFCPGNQSPIPRAPRLHRCVCASLPEEKSYRLSQEGKPYAIRFRTSNEFSRFKDLIYGTLDPQAAHEDLVLLKSDGLPTYHLANVIDDHYMKISHVIRGTEWLPTTAQHVALYAAFGWTPPQFAHVSLLLNERGQKLSKRDCGTSLATIKDEGKIYPEALLNYVALLGWSCQRKNEVMSKDELVENVCTQENCL